jgi:hypothetical protein
MGRRTEIQSAATRVRESRAYNLKIEAGMHSDRFPTSWGHVPQFCRARHCACADMEAWVPVDPASEVTSRQLIASW